MDLPRADSGSARPQLEEVNATRMPGHTLSVSEAAQLAARLANDACEKSHQVRPFLAEQHAAVVEKGRFQWGGDDRDALSGLFALVIFDLDGGHAEVKVYYHSFSY